MVDVSLCAMGFLRLRQAGVLRGKAMPTSGFVVGFSLWCSFTAI